jgi:hypothetical protein
MALYGVVGNGAITGTTASDTINFFAPTSRILDSTVLAVDGSDLIYLGSQGRTGVASATIGSADVVASSTGLILSTHLVGSAGTLYSTSTAISALSGDATVSVAITGVVTSQQATRSIFASQFYGNAGDDIISIGNQVQTATAVTLGGGAGNDLISNFQFVNGVTASGDTTVTGLTTTAFTSNNLFIEAGGGNDTIALGYGAAAADFANVTIGGGQGNDRVNITATANGSTFTSASLIALGGGDDTLTAALNYAQSASIYGGGGSDTITFSFVSAATSLFIGTDTPNESSIYDGNDLLSATGPGNTGIFKNSTIQAGGGNDTIALDVSAFTAGGDDGFNLYQLNAGNDVFSAFALNADTLQAGAGSDSISIGSASYSSLFLLGGDNDTITLVNGGGGGAGGSAFTANTVYGGLGADVFSSDVVTAAVGIGVTWAYSSYQDSTLSAMDTIAVGSTASTSTYTHFFNPGGLSLGSFRVGDQSATNGFVTFTAGTDGSVTARAAIIDAAMTTQGASVVFLDGNARSYLFIQGGSTDLITQMGSAAMTASATVTLAGGKTITVDFGNN